MAKKRTLKPYYGKMNQKLEQQAQVLTKQGKHEEAKNLIDTSDALIAARKAAAVGA